MGQITTLLNKRHQGSLPSNLEVNLRGEGKKHVKDITIRSGEELAIPVQPSMVRKVET